MDKLVDCAWLQAHLDDPDLRILDCTVDFAVGEGGKLSFFSGRDAFSTAHIPGAQFADILGALSVADSPHDFTLPSAEQFGEAMAVLGVGEGTRVVCYDTTFTMWATRVWWMLHAFGFENTAVLNGGMTAWRAAGGEVTSELVSFEPATFQAKLQQGWFVTKDEMKKTIDAPASACVIDALMPDMYNGKQNPYGRAGHIPGAINVPAVSVVDPETRLFIDDAAARKVFEQALADPEAAVVTYCGGGIAATADGFLLRQLGKTNVAVYDGSMAEWTADPAMPLVTGESPS